MAISEQCSRESSALRSDYYSTTEKTANPLNEWWTMPARDRARSARRRVRPHPHRARFRRDDARIDVLGDESKKRLRHSGFHNAPMTSRRRPAGSSASLEARANEAIEGSSASPECCAKFFPPMAQMGAAPGRKCAQSSESVPSDSRASTPARGLFTHHRVSAAMGRDARKPTHRSIAA
jgi:hypothetical protein